MADGDNFDVISPQQATYSKSRVPLFGALIDYIEVGLVYFISRTFTRAEALNRKESKGSLSHRFMAFVCLLLGLVSNVKFDVVTVDESPSSDDVHFMLLSKDNHLYIDDIDLSRVIWYLDASDGLAVLFSCILVWNSVRASSPLSEYLFLPWIGTCFRGVFFRQAPTVGALVYTIAVADGNVNPLFLTAFTFLFLLEIRIWLEISRILLMRWEQRGFIKPPSKPPPPLVETLWSFDDAQSVEVHNYVY